MFAVDWGSYSWDNGGKSPSTLSFKGIKEISEDVIIKIDGYPGYYPEGRENHRPYGKQGSVKKVQYFKDSDGERSGLIIYQNLMTLPGMSGSTVRVMRESGECNTDRGSKGKNIPANTTSNYRKVIGKSNCILTNVDTGHQDGRKVIAEITAIHVAFSETFRGNIACLLTPEKLKWIWTITGVQIELAPDEFYDENWPAKYRKEPRSGGCNICSIF